MANEKHLRILKQGVEAWNEWQQEKLGIPFNFIDTELFWSYLSKTNPPRADLKGADLSGWDLSNANLIWTNLSNANLNKVNLSQACLRKAILQRANLSGANLRMAYLQDADLRVANLSNADISDACLNRTVLCKAKFCKANLRGANLSNADISEANFEEANLSYAKLHQTQAHGINFIRTYLYRVDLNEADLSGSGMGFTNLIDLDLSVVKGLESIRHFAPSHISIDTIYRSKGKIPGIFLRGTGVPETFIAYASSLTNDVIQYYSCFISYSSKDDTFAQRLHADLQQKGIRCWFAPEDMKIGDKIRPRIDESIRIHDKLLLIISKNSLNSFWVVSEVEEAFEEEHKRNQTVLFPVRLDEAVMETDQAWAADIRRTRHIGNFSRWKDHDAYLQAFERLLRDLKAEG